MAVAASMSLAAGCAWYQRLNNLEIYMQSQWLKRTHLSTARRFIALKSGPGFVWGLGVCSFHFIVTAVV